MNVIAVGHALASPLIPIFQQRGWHLSPAETLEDGIKALRATRAPIVILDRDPAGADWRPTVRRLASEPNNPCVILASHVVDDYLLEEVIQHGGYDVLAKPFREEEVKQAIEFAWSAMKSRLSLRHTR